MITFTVPLKTANITNTRAHWSVKAKHAKKQRDTARLLAPAWSGGPLLVVHFVRFGLREMDDDGVRAALKHIRDGVADRLRVDDGTKLVTWKYEQARCKRGDERVEVSIYPARIDSADGMFGINLQHLSLTE